MLTWLYRPYDGKWSKTMIGYGPEENHFVAELTYNYGIGSYKLGNDFLGMTIQSNQVLANAKAQDWPVLHDEQNSQFLEAPGGYRFYIVDKPQPSDKGCIFSKDYHNYCITSHTTLVVIVLIGFRSSPESCYCKFKSREIIELLEGTAGYEAG